MDDLGRSSNIWLHQERDVAARDDVTPCRYMQHDQPIIRTMVWTLPHVLQKSTLADVSQDLLLLSQ